MWLALVGRDTTFANKQTIGTEPTRARKEKEEERKEKRNGKKKDEK